MDQRYAAHLIEPKISDQQYARLQAATTKSWDQSFVADPTNKPAIDAVVFRRHDNTVRHLIPWIERVKPLAGTQLIDFGSGCGSSALAFSHFASQIHGFEIDPPSVDAFQARMCEFGISNATVETGEPADVFARAIDRITPGAVVVLLAVVEHLLDRERVEYLHEIWKRLAPGDILVVAETPNYLAWMDTHTFEIPFAHMIPDQIFLAALNRDSRPLRFKSQLFDTAQSKGDAAVLDLRRRIGLGVTHHLFEVAFECDLDEIVIGDAFQPDIIDWFSISPDDRLLLSAWDMYNVQVPVGFARSVLSFIFRKPATSAHAIEAKRWNASWREDVIKTHSLVRQNNSKRSMYPVLATLG